MSGFMKPLGDNNHDSAIWDWFIVKRVAALLVIFLAAPTLAFGQTSGNII